VGGLRAHKTVGGLRAHKTVIELMLWLEPVVLIAEPLVGLLIAGNLPPVPMVAGLGWMLMRSPVVCYPLAPLPKVPLIVVAVVALGSGLWTKLLRRGARVAVPSYLTG
jgi:hypothetical protein